MSWKMRSPRVVKHPSVRRAEFLAVARELFFERGYDRTSIDEVICRAGVSKGAFYHHFGSKEELLEALAAQIAQEQLDQLGDVLADPTLNAFERLELFLARGRQLKVEQAPRMRNLFAAIFRPENVLLYHRTHMAIAAVTTPALSRIIQQGIEEGTFLVNDATIAAELLIQLSSVPHASICAFLNAGNAQDMRAAAAALERRIIEHAIAVDRVLGLPDGSVTFIEPGFMEAMTNLHMQPLLVATH